MRKDERENRREAPGGYRRGNYRPAPAVLSASAQQRAEQRRRHRKHVLIVFYLLLFLVVLGGAAALSLTVLFRITDISVTGTSRYSEQQIVDASGIQKGDNLFLVKTKADAQQIRNRLPYLGTVKISRRFPTQIQIDVKEEPVLGAAAFGTGFAVIGKDCTALETVRVLPKGCTELKGLGLKKVQAGFPVEFSDASRGTVFKSVMAAVEQRSFSKITVADFSQPSHVLLIYDGRVTVNLGMPTDLDYKLDYAKSLLQNNIKSTEKGTLNMSVAPETDKAYFDPDYSASSASSAKK